MTTQNQIFVRKGILADAKILAGFNSHLAWETENLKLRDNVVRAGVEALLRNPARGFYLLAERDGEIVGSLLVTFEWSDWRNGNFWWIQSVFVRAEFRRRGIYKRLYQHVGELAREWGEVCGLRLYVEKENRNAKKAYAKLGMKETRYRIFEAAW